MEDFNKREFYNRIDRLIRLKSTGNPKEFATKLKISESKLYRILNKLKNDASCPIEYCKCRNSYYYKKEGRLVIDFNFEELDRTKLNKIVGGVNTQFIFSDSHILRV